MESAQGSESSSGGFATGALAQELAAALSPGDTIVDPDVMDRYRRDRGPSSLPAGHPLAVVRPRSTAEVAAVVTIASQAGIPIVARGGGTGLSGAANAIDGGIVLSMEHLDRIIDVDPVERQVTVQPGVITAEIRQAAAEYGLWYAPDPSSFQISTIGGNIATNAGGLCCAKYGVTRSAVVSLEVVLASGQIVRCGSRTRKGVVGYDLVSLVVGSEGTLAVVTEATLRLIPHPPPPSTVVASMPSYGSLGVAIEQVHRSSLTPALFEIMDVTTVRAVEEMLSMGLDTDTAGLVLLQFDDATAARSAEIAQRILLDAGADECYSTDDVDEGALMLGARRAALDAVERLGEALLDDICVPVGKVNQAIVAIAEISERHDVPIAVFGHAGDGNLHPTILVGSGAQDRGRAWCAFDDIIGLAQRLGGTATGEHGVGTLKIDHARSELGQNVIDLHRAVKAAFDPGNILNPGRGW